MTPFAPVPVYGHRIVSVRVHGIDFTYSRHTANVPRHAHKNGMIVLGVSGAFEESYTGRGVSTACEFGTALVRPAGEPHSNRFARRGARDLAIEFPDDALEWLQSPRPVLSAVASYRDDHVAVLARRAIRELATNDNATALALEAVACELMAWLVRRESTSDAHSGWMRRVREFVIQEWQHRRITLTDLARVGNVHPVHLARVYGSTFGETPAASIRRLRTEWAARELLRSSRSIAEIAAQAGFTDQSHMTRVFRGTFGVTPRAWRRGR
jgi:AraC family transcriptional regulator